MNCEQYRLNASAALDGESVSVPIEQLEDHRHGCPECTSWQRDVEGLSRRVRVRPAESAPAGLVTAVLTAATLPDRRLRRRIAVLRAALALVGLVQLAIAVPAFADADMGMAMSMHASHESAAWNLAVGLAVLFVAWRPLRVAGALAAVGTFVVVLAVLSVIDVVQGVVGIDRLITHVGVLAAAVVMVALQRAQRGLPVRAPNDPVVTFASGPAVGAERSLAQDSSTTAVGALIEPARPARRDDVA